MKTVQTTNQLCLADEFISTKSARERRAREILHKYNPGESLDPMDEAFMISLLLNHHRAAEKIGCGVAAIQVRIDPRFEKHRSFWIIRKDLSETDFSFRKCMHQPSALVRFQNTCRAAIAEQIQRFKRNYFASDADEDGLVQCPVTQVWVDFDNSHVDHEPPDTFAKLVKRFIAENAIDVDKVQYIDDSIGCKFANDEIQEKWRRFHVENCKLRIVSEEANLSIVPRLERLRDANASA